MFSLVRSTCQTDASVSLHRTWSNHRRRLNYIKRLTSWNYSSLKGFKTSNHPLPPRWKKTVIKECVLFDSLLTRTTAKHLKIFHFQNYFDSYRSGQYKLFYQTISQNNWKQRRINIARSLSYHATIPFFTEGKPSNSSWTKAFTGIRKS